MATKAKSSTKKTRATVSTAAKKPSTTVASRSTVNSASFTDWLTGGKSVFTPKTALGALLAELVGTFILAGAVIALQGSVLLVAFALTVATLATITLSGGHLNPAISFAAWVTRRISGWRALGYIVAQVLGGMLALLVAHALLPIQAADQTTGAAAQIFQIPALTAGKEWYIFFAQMLGTAVFAFAVGSAAVYRKEKLAAAFVVGFGLYVGLLFAGSFGVLNPAVALAVGGLKWSVWPLAVFIVAPLVGAAIGMGLHKLLNADVVAVDELARANRD
ncbi:MAG TPA: aquaporin [Candidatus Saccharimonadales bacterium]|jgi:aquaporin Z|nr:aquaporin [Candidatus Saccharimonadales bacterium]